ncbi:MAG: energy-coupling factor ABC transporter permease [Caldilineaceae bacterium]
MGSQHTCRDHWLGVGNFTIAYALRQTRSTWERQIPLLGVLAAFIFAAQAINFPVAGGTSGHLLGGALRHCAWSVGCRLGHDRSSCATRVALQGWRAFAMGWNIINMGILTAFTGHLIYMAIKRVFGTSRTKLLMAGAIGAWLSVEVGATATAIQLALSGTTPS